MRKIITVGITVTLCLLLLGACVNKGEASAEPVGASAETIGVTPEPASSAEAVSPASGAEAAGQSEAQAEVPSDPVIIAESSNTISDAEKQEILDSLMGEIDSVLGNIDDLEDLDDSDLGTDNIG